jgi:hypothetical protein
MVLSVYITEVSFYQQNKTTLNPSVPTIYRDLVHSQKISNKDILRNTCKELHASEKSTYI